MSDHHVHRRREGLVLAIAAGLAAALGSASLADVLTVPTDHPTIQAAVDAAANGDEIIVLPGIYTGGDPVVRIANKDVVLRSTAGAAATVIQGDGGRVMELIGTGSATVIEGFTIRDGFAVGGGAGLLVDGGGPTLRDCAFTNNNVGSTTVASPGGGGLLVQTSSPLIERCRFANNFGGYGGKGGGASMISSSPLIIDSRFEANEVGSPGAGVGGGLYVSGGAPVIDRCLIIGNASPIGGGISSHFSALTVRSSRISGNAGTISANMNGIWTNCIQPPHPTVIDSWICGNAGSQINQNSGSCALTITDSVISNSCPPCMPADLDGSGVVGFDDLAILLADWNAGGAADLDLDGVVGFGDLVILLAAWDRWCVGDQIF